MKFGLIVQKKEMTRIQVDDEMIPVTLLTLDKQYVAWYRTVEKDWYNAVIVWVWPYNYVTKNKKELVKYNQLKEFPVDEEFMSKYKIGDEINVDLEVLTWWKVDVTWISKWKGFAGVMKRHHAKWWPKTHGSKFHRQVWSMWNRKPRRVQKWHPHAGHMWNEKVTIKNVRVLNMLKDSSENILLIKWSVPGYYNSYLLITLY